MLSVDDFLEPEAFCRRAIEVINRQNMNDVEVHSVSPPPGQEDEG